MLRKVVTISVLGLALGAAACDNYDQQAQTPSERTTTAPASPSATTPPAATPSPPPNQGATPGGATTSPSAPSSGQNR